MSTAPPAAFAVSPAIERASPPRPAPPPPFEIQKQTPQKRSEADVEVVTDDRAMQVSAYLSEAHAGADRSPAYCAQLGLAVEALREGMTIEQLWGVL